MIKRINTQEHLIRCEKCHYLTSRLSYTPLHHYKLPLWTFGYILEEAYLQSPKVLTATMIKKRLGVCYKTALLIKRRLQIFTSDRREDFKKFFYEKLNQDFPDVNFAPDKKVTNRRKRTPERKAVNADTMVLFSASQRANKGRKRYKHSGCTASIYLSDKLGGKQVGTLVHTIAIKGGGIILDSVPDQKMNTLGPIVKAHIPAHVPIFTDKGCPWLSAVYKNHRMINHSAKSPDNRYRWAKNRWSKDGVHIQAAEGNHRAIKQAMSGYGYIRPEYSQMYLNEYMFFKNLKAYGWEAYGRGQGVESDASGDIVEGIDKVGQGNRQEQGARDGNNKTGIRNTINTEFCKTLYLPNVRIVNKK